MKSFDVFMWQPPGWPEPHPCVIVSHPDRADRKTPIEVLMCSSKRATRQADTTEFILDQADGLDWPSICKCDILHAVPRSEFKGQKGQVSVPRRAPLIRQMIGAHGWAEILGWGTFKA